MVNGSAAPGFEPVRDAFADNLESGRDVGAAFAAYHRGRKVVDLWGGTADTTTGRPWEEDSIVLVFSTTKGATALCANLLAERGVLDMDAPVARYWPEFAQGGKADIPVKFLLSHQAGLAWIDGEMSLEEALSWEPVVSALARQTPHWEPGERHGYHATTYGWLVGEVIRRITGASVGTFFRTEIAEPLGLDFWIGLPEEQEPRVVPVIPFELPAGSDLRAMADSFLGPDTSLGKALSAPGGALAELAPTSRTAERPWLPAPLVARLAAYDWPGNVRQLRNMARQLAIAGSAAEEAPWGPRFERLLCIATRPAPAGPIHRAGKDALLA